MYYYVSNVPESYYNAYFRDDVWMKGASEGAPTNTTPNYRSSSPYFAVESIDWESYLVRVNRWVPHSSYSHDVVGNH